MRINEARVFKRGFNVRRVEELEGGGSGAVSSAKFLETGVVIYSYVCINFNSEITG